MKVIETGLPGVLILEPRVFEDERGSFFESWNAETFRNATGFDGTFVQDNHSHSRSGVLRGIHYQLSRPQGKLVRVCAGEVLDVAVDLRPASPCLGKWTSVVLSAGNRRQIWIPPGFGHGFVVRSESADVLYKTTDYRYPELERCILWNDRELAIDWALERSPVLSVRDAAGRTFAEMKLQVASH